jgi:hypothetical protein
MSLAEELELLRARGFDLDRAQIVVLLREAAILMFQAFPDSFLLYGGANLILFHDSLRTSRDLDLLSQGAPLPKAEDTIRVLSEGLQELGKLLGLAPLKVNAEIAEPAYLKLEVASREDRRLFTVDLGGLGSVLKSGIEEHTMEAVSLNMTATIRSVSRDHLLLQKAEAFVFRAGVKARDAYDIQLLLDAGGILSGELENHLTDALAIQEVGRGDIIARIEQVTAKLCRRQLADVLPAKEYGALERADFQPLRSAVTKLFQRWL